MTLLNHAMRASYLSGPRLMCRRFICRSAVLGTIQVNDRLPTATLYDGSPANPVTTDQLTRGRTLVIIGTPGAFTPACSQTHLPGYVRRADEIRSSGVDEIVCVAVNDPFVTAAWSRDQAADGKVRVLSDSHGELTRALGLELDLTAALGTHRCKRFSMLVRDGVVVELQVEPDGKGLSCSLAEVLAEKLNKKA